MRLLAQASAPLWWRLPALFVALAFPVMVLTAIFTPPAQSPDEVAHLVRANGLLQGHVFLTRQPVPHPAPNQPRDEVGVGIDSGLFKAGFGFITPMQGRWVVTASDAAKLEALGWSHHQIFSNIPNTATYFPLAYMPDAVGLGVGRLLGVSPFHSILLGRLANMLAYLALGVVTLLVARRGRAVFLAILLLPMSLFLGATLDQDGLLIALTCLACAGFTRGSLAGHVLALAAFVVVALAKPPYLLLMAIFALPLAWAGFWRRACAVVLVSLPVLAWVGFVMAFVAVPFGKPLYHPGPLFQGGMGAVMGTTDPALNLHILLAHVGRFFTLPVHTISLFGVNWLQGMVGMLGLLDLVFPAWFYNLWWGVLAFSFLMVAFSATPFKGPERIGWLNNIVVLLVVSITIWAVMISFYLNWTNVGMDFIGGIQGRYALLILPFLVFAVPATRLRLPESVGLVPVLLLGVFDIAYIPFKLVMFYLPH